MTIRAVSNKNIIVSYSRMSIMMVKNIKGISKKQKQN